MPRSGNIYYTDSGSQFSETAVKHPAKSPQIGTLILIHGAGGSNEIWPHQLRRIAGHRILAPDLPAHGKSNGSPETSIPGYAARLLEWIDQLNIGRSVLVGHSMGAAIALMLALDFPERVDRLILLGAAERFLVNPLLLEKLAVQRDMQAAVNMLVAWSFSKSVDQPIRQAYSATLLSNQLGVLRHDFLACSEFDLRARVKEISRPTLLLCGNEDVLVPLSRSQELEAHLVRSSLKIVDGAGHMLMQEKPSVVAALIGLELGISF